MTHIAYFDCIAGASGDMILGAMVDAGLSEDTLRDLLGALHLPDFELHFKRVSKNGFQAVKVDVQVADNVPERHLADIETMIKNSDLAEKIQARALEIFQRIGQVEANIHGVSLDQVHLHELGGVDTIVDVVGALVGLEALGVERVYASPLPLGRGFIQGAHGSIPLPAPATLALLKGAPVVGSPIEKELVTPTGAALLTSLAHGFGSVPAMTLTGIGYGAGGRDLPIPNVVRLMLGDAAPNRPGTTERLVVLETNVDDLNPEIYDYVMTRLFAAGALDVFLTPIQMKKNRPATLVQVLCRPAEAEMLTAILFRETSTLGVRRQEIDRVSLHRHVQEVTTPYGPVRVKYAELGAGQRKWAPEFEDCRRLAEANGVPLRDVYRQAEIAAGQAAEHAPLTS